MKKALLFFTVAAMTVTSASAINPFAKRLQNVPTDGPFQVSPVLAPEKTNQSAKATRAEESITFGYAGEPDQALTFGTSVKAGYYVWGAFEIPAADLTAYVGNEISSVIFTTGTSDNDKNLVSEAEVFVSDDLTKLPTFTTVELDSEAWKNVEVSLTEPFKITGEKNLYIGYRILINSTNQAGYYFPIDNIPTNNNTFLASVTQTETDVPEFENYAVQFGSLCVWAKITGENLPADYATLDDAAFPFYVEPDSSIYYQVLVSNKGIADITELKFHTTGTNDVDEMNTVTLSTPIKSGESGVVTVQNVSNPKEGYFTITTELAAVNGTERASAQKSGQVAVYKDGYTRNILLEEFTGTWCGWCPRGIVMMEYIKENYPDIIRIAYHYSSSSKDPMQSDSCLDFGADYATGFPSALANRMYSITPAGNDNSYYKDTFDYLNSFPAYAEISINAEMDENLQNVNVNTTTSFSLDVDAQHLLSFVVVEDGVGPYYQTNYYAGGSYGNMGGWESKSKSVKTIYEDVARYMQGYPGIASSLPATVEKGKSYEGQYSVPVTSVTGNSFRLVGLVVNASNGIVVNAVELPMSKTAAVEGIEADGEFENGVVEVYSLDGRRVNADNLSNGIYIMKANGKTKKVLVK